MKKIVYLFAAAAISAGSASCSDRNDVVDDLIDGIKNRPVVRQVEYTLTAADYASVSAAALGDARDDSANAALAAAVRTTNSLNSFATGDKYIPALLAAKYPALGLESTARVTYAYTPDHLAGLTTDPPAGELDVILEEKFERGYNGSANPYERWNKNGWTQVVTKGSKYWQIRSYNNNQYGQVTANGGAAEDMEVYAVSPAIPITKPSDNHFSFDVCAGYWNWANLSVLVSEDANAAADPAAARWTDVTGRFNIPATPASGYGTLGPAGRMNLDSYVGKTIRIAFKYTGTFVANNNADNRSTTFQIDNVLVANGKVADPKPGGVFVNDPEQGGWVVFAGGIALTPADYAAMGVASLSAATAPGYLPVFLAQKFPYAQEGDRKAVLYGSAKDEYIFTGGRWIPTLTGAPLTEQFVNDGSKWIFDPTVRFVMSNDDYAIMVDYMLADPARAVYVDAGYRNEEWYYGFGWRYDNVSFRLSYRTGSYNQFSRHDTELHALDGKPAEQAALLWRRLEQEGMPRLLSLKYPLSPATAQGVQLCYEVTVRVYFPDGVTNTSKYYRMRYKVSTEGSAGVPPTFGFVGTEELGTSLP